MKFFKALFGNKEKVQKQTSVKSEDKHIEDYLVFDNFYFKLAVIDILMYKQKCLGEQYLAADEFNKKYTNRNVPDQEAFARLQPYIEKGREYFDNLQIPTSLADEIRFINLDESEISPFYHINPMYLDYDEYYGEWFDLETFDISERELKQFPKLKNINFPYKCEPSAILRERIERCEIEINSEI